jgi:outer membrane lipoprotein-sorting protein
MIARRYMGRLLVLLSISMVVFASGCGDAEKLPPDQVIQKSVNAMQGANSFHFTMDTSKLQKPVPGIFITRAEGDVAKPDKLAGDVSGTASGIPVNIKAVVDGQNQYMTDPISGRWMPMSPAFNVIQFFDPSKGVTDILANVKNLSDQGTESVEGNNTYKLGGTVPAEALKALSSEVTATQDLTGTLWIGTDDFLLRKVQLQGPLLGDEPADIVRTIAIKDYNKEVKIETPVIK